MRAVLAFLLAVTVSVCVAFDPTKDIVFKLYTPLNKYIPQIIQLNDLGVSLTATNFNAAYPTKILVHGWLNDGPFEVTEMLRDAYLKCRNVNVIVVDWTLGTNVPFFLNSYRVEDVGERTAFLIQHIRHYMNVDPVNISIIGHSIGAHIAGFAGYNLIGPAGPTLGSIVALDPVSIVFQFTAVNRRLSKTNAKYVQVIRTSPMAMDGELGHSNFYVNYLGGQGDQCYGDLYYCSHAMAVHFFAVSINREILATRCENYTEIITNTCNKGEKVWRFGGEPDTNILGIFYLKPQRKYYPYFTGELACKLCEI